MTISIAYKVCIKHSLTFCIITIASYLLNIICPFIAIQSWDNHFNCLLFNVKNTMKYPARWTSENISLRCQFSQLYSVIINLQHVLKDSIFYYFESSRFADIF